MPGGRDLSERAQELLAHEAVAQEAGSGLSVMELVDVRVELPDPFALACLVETEGLGRQLEIPIGIPDATALAHALHRRLTPRPLTHELFADVLQRFLVDVVALRVVGRRAGTYLAELDLSGLRGREVVPCRPSDGMNLVLRQAVPPPIMADARLMEHEEDVVPAGEA